MNDIDEINVLIAGESSLASLGCGGWNAFDFFPEEVRYDRKVNFINTSMVGMTAADAYSNLKYTLPKNAINLLILHLGNCDACGYGFRKKREPLWLGGYYPRLANSIRDTYRSSVSHTPTIPRSSVSTDDYRYFMEAIIARTLQRNIRLLMILPSSNSRFPPCNTLPNRHAYHLFNIREQISYCGGGNCEPLKAANVLVNERRFEEAMAAYSAVIVRPVDPETIAVAKNNCAYLHFIQGNPQPALDMLSSIHSGGTSCYPLILYNMALAASALHDEPHANEYFDRALQIDAGSYRITSRYREVLFTLGNKFRENIDVIDTAEFFTENDFFDYCHPDRNGHHKLFIKIKEKLESAFSLQQGELRPAVSYHSSNPDRYLGYTQHPFRHFRLLQSTDKSFTAKLLDRAHTEEYHHLLSVDEISKADPSHRSMTRILKHPLFGMQEFLASSPPSNKTDQGRFAEAYFIRHLIPLYTEELNMPELATIFQAFDGISPQRERMRLVQTEMLRWCSIPGLNDLKRIIDGIPLECLITRIRLLLAHCIEQEPVVTTKYRTITNWFFRESLLFGTTSDCLMFCDRMSLFDLATSCFAGLWYLNNVATQEAAAILQIVRTAGKLIEIHRQYLEVGLRGGYKFTEDSFAEYRQKIRELTTL